MPRSESKSADEQGFWREETVLDDLRRAVVEHPDRPAIISSTKSGTRIDTVTFAGLESVSDRIAAGLRTYGIGRGDVVSLQLPTTWQFTALHLACVKVGAVTHPISPILRRRELLIQLRLAGSKLLVAGPDAGAGGMAEDVRSMAGSAPSLQHVFVLGDDLEPALFEADLTERAPAARDGLCELQFTSGTTGLPKGVFHTHNSIYAGSIGVARALNLGPEDSVLMPATFGHQTGFLFGCFLPIAIGATAVLQDRWDPSLMLDLADRFGTTWSSIPPPMVADLCEAARVRGSLPDTLKVIRSSGGPTPASLADEVNRKLGADLLPSWGLTETGVCTLRRPGEDHEARSAGRALPGVEVRYRQRGDARALVVRTPGMFAGYLGEYLRPDDSSRWFETGDLGEPDRLGGVRITGRAKDLIIRGGENIPVAEMEVVLAQDPTVAELTIVAVPDSRLGERACAVVVPSGEAGPTLADLTSRLEREGVTKQFWPEYLLLVERLPRTSIGKVRKESVRRLARQRIAASDR